MKGSGGDGKWEKRKWGKKRKKRGMSNLEKETHDSEVAGVLVMVVMATVGQTQETMGGDDVTRAK